MTRLLCLIKIGEVRQNGCHIGDKEHNINRLIFFTIRREPRKFLSDVLRKQLLEVSLSSKNDEEPIYGCVCCSDHNSIVGYRRWLHYRAHPKKGTERFALRNVWYLSSQPIHAFFSTPVWCLQRPQKWPGVFLGCIYFSSLFNDKKTQPSFNSFLCCRLWPLSFGS